MRPAPQVDHLRTIPYAVANTFLNSAISQSFSGLYWLEKFLAEHRPCSIIELGTGHGTLTCLFGLHCPGQVVTFDLHDGPGGHIGKLFGLLGIQYHKRDIQHPEAPAEILRTVEDRDVSIMPHPRFVFCDNGNKHLEFALYAPWLKDGDAIAVHDYGTEFHITKEVRELVDKHDLHMWRPESLEDGSLLAFWVKGSLGTMQRPR